MVKITEGWIAVQDGTKLYTKTWEVSQSRILILQMSISHQTAAAYYFFRFWLLQSAFFMEAQYIVLTFVFTAGYETGSEFNRSTRFQRSL